MKKLKHCDNETTMLVKNSNKFSFAVLGDTHLTRPEWHPGIANADAGKQHDVAKYVANVEQTVKPILSAIAESEAEFLIHSGDLVEGVDAPNEREEMGWALEFIAAAGIPCVFARGNHDWRHAYADVIRPANARALEQPLESNHFSFDAGNSRFVFVDSETVEPDGEAAGWLEEMLQGSGAQSHVFVVAHSPVWNTGRPFFHDRGFAQVLSTLAARHGVDALFCGHTHNQSITLHRTSGIPLLQVKTCAVGWGEQPFLPLDQVKTWLPSVDSLLWSWPGYLENSAPGWCLVQVDGDEVALRWRDVENEDHVVIRWRARGGVEEVYRRPVPICPPPTADELRGAMAGWLCLSIYAAGNGSKQVMLGATLLGEFPTTVPYYHHRTPIASEALHGLDLRNHAHIVAAPDDPYCVGSLIIELILADGRTVRTQPTSQICGTTRVFGGWEETHAGDASGIALNFV